MSKKEGKDYICLIWKDPITRRQYIIAQLSKNGQYEFSYGYEIQDAINKGFELLIPFTDITATYKSNRLFSTFSSRLPDEKRRGIEKILDKYGLKEYDEYKLLKRSGARLPIDTLEFIDPIFDDDLSEMSRIFYMAGPRHYIGCNGESCNTSIDIEVGEELDLVMEPTCKYDDNAIMVFNSKKELVGYLPRYYSEGVTKLLHNGFKHNCAVIEVNKRNNCNECIKVKLILTDR